MAMNTPLDELLDQCTRGQLKYLAHVDPKSRFMCNVQSMGRATRDSDPAVLITQKFSMRDFTWAQVKTLRRSTNVARKALTILNRKFPPAD